LTARLDRTPLAKEAALVASAIGRDFQYVVRGRRRGTARTCSPSHCEASAQYTRAIQHLRSAYHAALRQTAFAEALVHLRHAISLTRMPEPKEAESHELEIQLELGRLMTQIAGYGSEESFRAHTRARELAQTVGDNNRYAEACSGLSMNMVAAGKNGEVIELLAPVDAMDRKTVSSPSRCAVAWMRILSLIPTIQRAQTCSQRIGGPRLKNSPCPRCDRGPLPARTHRHGGCRETGLRLALDLDGTPSLSLSPKFSKNEIF
jgi:hypothetical protein